MNHNERQIARVRFTGELYEEHVVDADAMRELIHFQGILTALARDLWKTAHPERQNLPPNFDERTQVGFRRVDAGSTTIALEILPHSQQLELHDYLPAEMIEAVSLAYRTFEAANDNRALPESVPAELLPTLAEFGRKLRSNAQIQFAPPGEAMTSVSSQAREWLSTLVRKSYTDQIDLCGRVLLADVRQRRFQIWIDDGTHAFVSFTPEQESDVTTALKEHNAVKLVVQGQGEFDADGRLQRIQTVEQLRVISGQDSSFDSTAKPIQDIILDAFSEVPDEEWSGVPSDLSHRHDFYLRRGSER